MRGKCLYKAVPDRVRGILGKIESERQRRRKRREEVGQGLYKALFLQMDSCYFKRKTKRRQRQRQRQVLFEFICFVCFVFLNLDMLFQLNLFCIFILNQYLYKVDFRTL